MKDVAVLAGVSLKTVSRVVNDEASVTDDTRERVLRAIQTLKYLPDAAAANLARVHRETHSIALLISFMDNPFSASVFQGVEAVARARNVAVFAASTEGDPQIERNLVHAFASRQVDGFIITPTGCDHRPIAAMIGDSSPSVYVDRSPLGVAADVVATNNREAAMSATAHLLSFGHRRIAFLGDHEDIETATERRQGYFDALGFARIPVDPDLIVMGITTTADGERAAESLFNLPVPPTAVFASRNMAAIGTLRVLKDRGLSHQVGVVSMDDIELSDLVDPPLTVMAQDPVAMGEIAAQRLFARCDGADTPPARYIVPSVLVERGSGEIPAPGVKS